LFQAEGLSNAALEVIALRGRRAVLARYENTQPRPPCRASFDEEGITVGAPALPLSQQPLEIRLAPQPPGCAEPKALLARGGSDYSASRRRPRARRLRNTLRPPGVRLRTRNPWRRARRVLEG